MRISIAMTTFDGSAWVEEQLESFAAQTRPPDELVVCDDCSADDTVTRLERFAARAPFPVRIEKNPHNLTTTPNFGKAISLCTGDVVFLSDQDDVWHPDKTAAVCEVFERRPEVGAVFSDGRVCNGRLEPAGHTLWEALWFSPAERALVREGRATEVFVKHVVAAGSTLAFRSSYRDLYLPFPDLHDCHDAWVSFLIACAAPVALVERELIDYRVHGENQFGLRKLGLLEQLEKARWQLASGIFEHGVRFFTQVRDRLVASSREIDPAVLERVEAKIEHCRSRNEMPSSFVARVPVIAREWARGNYGRFSYGLKSVAQDVWLR